eukprot:gene21339-biopygen7300
MATDEAWIRQDDRRRDKHCQSDTSYSEGHPRHHSETPSELTDISRNRYHLLTASRFGDVERLSPEDLSLTPDN